MAGSVNKIILVGNLGKDPEFRTTQDGQDLTTFSMATSDTWTDKASGERKEKTEWHRVVVYNERIVKFSREYLRKGRKVYIEGKLQTRKWQDKNTGEDRYTTEIVVDRFKGELVILDSARGGDDTGAVENDVGHAHGPSGSGFTGRPVHRPEPAHSTGWSAPRGGGIIDDEIPFGAEWR